MAQKTKTPFETDVAASARGARRKDGPSREEFFARRAMVEPDDERERVVNALHHSVSIGSYDPDATDVADAFLLESVRRWSDAVPVSISAETAQDVLACLWELEEDLRLNDSDRLAEAVAGVRNEVFIAYRRSRSAQIR